MFKAIAQFFRNLFQNQSLQKFEAFCEEVFIAEKPIVLGALRDVAIAAVQSAEATGLSSSSKREQAFTEITAKAQTIGLTAGASMISLALEMAVTAIRNSQNNKGVVS